MPSSLLPRDALILCAVALMGCATPSNEGIQSVSVAPDDQSFAFSYLEDDVSLIAIRNLGADTSRVVLKATGGIRYERPIFSKQGDELLFIARQRPDRSDLRAVGVDGSGARTITTGQQGTGNILDYCQSGEGRSLYFINSGFFGHYSPIASSRPHEMDFYSIQNDGSGLQRLSYSKRYALHGVSVSPSGSHLYSRSVVLDLTAPPKLARFNYFSRLLVFAASYPLSEFRPDGSIVLASGKAERIRRGPESGEKIVLEEGWAVYGSGLYLANINKQQVEEIVYLPSHLDSPALFHREDRVLFIRNDSVWGGESGRELWSVDLDGRNLHRIDLALPEASR